jgi:4-amino-4-deoxy-L-arabinose transferase-like glycosyltransferase
VPETIESWLAAHRRAVVITLVACSVVLRASYFIQLNAGPCVWQHRWEATDMHFFDAWARAIAAGDWLTDQSLHPYLPWHQELAEGYLRAHPARAAALQQAGAADPVRALYERWTGGKVFHQEPLYPYLVAVTYRLLGPDVRWVFAWQLAAGVVLNVLLYLTVRHQLGDLVATVAAGLSLLAGPLLYHEMLLLRESLIAAAGVGLVYLTERAQARGTWPSWLALGVTFGLALLLKTTFALYGLGVLVALVVLLRRRPRTLFASAAAVVGGAALALAPAIARNLAVGVPALGLSSVGSLVFVMSNAGDFRSGVGFIVSRHTAEIMGSTDGRFLPAAIATLATHPNMGSVFGMLAAKFTTLWHWFEVPNNSNFYYYRLHAPVLWWMPVSFLVLSPLGLVGLVLGRRALRTAWPLYLLVGCHAVNLIFFYTLSRLRIPLLPALAPFAALTLVEIGRSVGSGRLGRGAVLGTAVAALGVWTGRPLPPEVPLIASVDYWAAYNTYYNPLLDQAQDDEDWTRAADVLAQSLRLEPETVRQLGSTRRARTGAEVDLATLFASVHDAYAQMLERSGQGERARREAERARSLTAAAEGKTP